MTSIMAPNIKNTTFHSVLDFLKEFHTIFMSSLSYPYKLMNIIWQIKTLIHVNDKTKRKDWPFESQLCFNCLPFEFKINALKNQMYCVSFLMRRRSIWNAKQSLSGSCVTLYRVDWKYFNVWCSWFILKVLFLTFMISSSKYQMF